MALCRCCRVSCPCLACLAPPRLGLPHFAWPAPDAQEETQDAVLALTQAARARGQSAATVLLLGKGGVGKSATVNGVLGEKAAVVSTFQPAGGKPTRFTRTLHDGFALTLIDTPSLLEQDAVSVAVRARQRMA